MSDPADDPTISDDDYLLRRVPRSPSFVVWDEQTGTERPATGSFRIDENGVSVYLLSALRAVQDPCRMVAGPRFGAAVYRVAGEIVPCLGHGRGPRSGR